MKGYWIILKTDVVDKMAQEEYGRLWAPIADKYQARINSTTVPPMLKEMRDAADVLVVEFPSYEMAQACYEDADYQEARKFASKAAKRDLLIVKGDLS